MTRASFAYLIDSVPFTKATRDGQTSLGGSESACIGLARALAGRGHDVHVFATKLEDEARGPDAAGVVWHAMEDFWPMNQFVEWDVVCVLRSWPIFGQAPIRARMRVLWNQDLMLPGPMVDGIMSVAWAIDEMFYVSEYHRMQWEELQPQIAKLGWVTRNGYDPAMVPAEADKDPNRVIHISRPERGLAPLLQMWPKVRERNKNAILHVCRYSSMYDQGPGSWSDVCDQFDRQVERVQDEVGGIAYLGGLNKVELYQAIADSAVMWYPGIPTFAETSCIAAIEAQACGTPFVGSDRGALRETVPSGILIGGDAHSKDYQESSLGALFDLMDACKNQSASYRTLQRHGKKHVERYRYDAIAAEWEAHIDHFFKNRRATQGTGILRNLLHHDDHTAAQVLAHELGDTEAVFFCQRVMDGKDQLAEDYGSLAMTDPEEEADMSLRFQNVSGEFEGCKHVLDIACGNGSGAIAMAKHNPEIKVTGLDYSKENIDRANMTAKRLGLDDRLNFIQADIYDYDSHTLTTSMLEWLDGRAYDGCFVGEFAEHVVSTQLLVDGLEAGLAENAKVIYTFPSGAFIDLRGRDIPVKKGHVHHFKHDDIQRVWGKKKDFKASFIFGGLTDRGDPFGTWMVSYRKSEAKAGTRDFTTLIERTRPMPWLSVGIIACDEESNIGRCLDEVWRIADEIVIGDTGCQDDTTAIAKKFGARIVQVQSVNEQREGFAGARNDVLKACTGDWFMWIDADEILLQKKDLRRYLDGPVFNGFVLHQTHLYIDAAPTWDIPVRVFRNTGKVRFYGCVHEQPQDGDANKDIFPTLALPDVKIAHLGYLTEEGRESKRVHRNLPLLKRDMQVFPERELGKVLLIREAVIQGDVFRAKGMETQARLSYAYALRLFVENFDAPDHKYHQLSRPWYEAAIQHVGTGWEQEVAIAGKEGGLGRSQAKPERVWVRDGAEFKRLMDYKVSKMAEQMKRQPIKTDPDQLVACYGHAMLKMDQKSSPAGESRQVEADISQLHGVSQ